MAKKTQVQAQKPATYTEAMDKKYGNTHEDRVAWAKTEKERRDKAFDIWREVAAQAGVKRDHYANAKAEELIKDTKKVTAKTFDALVKELTSAPVPKTAYDEAWAVWTGFCAKAEVKRTHEMNSIANKVIQSLLQAHKSVDEAYFIGKGMLTSKQAKVAEQKDNEEAIRRAETGEDREEADEMFAMAACPKHVKKGVKKVAAHKAKVAKTKGMSDRAIAKKHNITLAQLRAIKADINA